MQVRVHFNFKRRIDDSNETRLKMNIAIIDIRRVVNKRDGGDKIIQRT